MKNQNNTPPHMPPTTTALLAEYKRQSSLILNLAIQEERPLKLSELKKLRQLSYITKQYEHNITHDEQEEIQIVKRPIGLPPGHTDNCKLH